MSLSQRGAQPMEPDGGAAVFYRVCSLAGLEDELGASVVGMWNGAASELNGAVFTSGDWISGGGERPDLEHRRPVGADRDLRGADDAGARAVRRDVGP